MRNTIENVLAITGLFLLLVVLPTLSYVSAKPTFAGVTAGATVASAMLDHVFANGLESSACAPGRIIRANIKYPNVPPSGVIRRNVDVTQFANIWGHANTTDLAVPYPGRSGAVPAVSGWSPAGRYIAAEFIPPTAGTYNVLRLSTYSDITADPLAVDASVSTLCGDFAPRAANCAVQGVGPGEALLKLVQAPHTNGCVLVTGRTYYMHVGLVDRQAAGGYLTTNNTVGVQP